MKKRKPFNKFLFFLSWIFFSFASILVSYWLVGALTPKEDLSYGLRLLSILQDPFNDYFNDYSPIVMVMAFLLNEIIFGLIFISRSNYTEAESGDPPAERKNIKSGKTNKKKNDRPSTMDLFIDEPEKQEKEKEKDPDPDEEEKESSAAESDRTVKNRDEVSVETLRNKKAGKTTGKKIKDEEERELVIDNDIFMKMINAGYDVDQINAMLELTYYIPDVDDIKLKSMFDPSMKPAVIREYIEAYFG